MDKNLAYEGAAISVTCGAIGGAVLLLCGKALGATAESLSSVNATVAAALPEATQASASNATMTFICFTLACGFGLYMAGKGSR